MARCRCIRYGRNCSVRETTLTAGLFVGGQFDSRGADRSTWGVRRAHVGVQSVGAEAGNGGNTDDFGHCVVVTGRLLRVICYLTAMRVLQARQRCRDMSHPAHEAWPLRDNHTCHGTGQQAAASRLIAMGILWCLDPSAV